jgi:dTMP kinase
MSDLAKRLAGKFLVLDGPDGSGKSTQLARLRDYLAGLGAQVQTARDPGETEVGERIRALLLDRQTGRLAPVTETLLFMASRAQLVYEKIRPALKAGKVVVCDRFVSSTLAYQGASGVEANLILNLAESAVQGIWPDLTVILDVPVEVGMQRAGAPRERRGPSYEPEREQLSLFGDRMEARSDAFHREVRRRFRELVKDYPHPVTVIDGQDEPDVVLQAILDALEKTFPVRED